MSNNVALGGLSIFGNRTKVLAETAANQIGESAQSAQKAIGDTSTGELSFAFSSFTWYADSYLRLLILNRKYFILTGIWGRFRSGVDQVKGSIFERNDPNQHGQGYPLSQYGVPPPQRGQYPPGHPGNQPGGQRGFPPQGYPPQPQPGGQRGNAMPPPIYPPQQPRAGFPPGGFMPRPGYMPPYPPGIGPNPQQQVGATPPIQSQWGGGMGGSHPPAQQRGQPPNRPPVQGQRQQGQGQQEGQQQGQRRPGPYGQYPTYDNSEQDPTVRQSQPVQQQQQQQQPSSRSHNPADHPGWRQ